MPAQPGPRRARAPAAPRLRSRAFCFTLNNYEEPEITALLDILTQSEVKGYKRLTPSTFSLSQPGVITYPCVFYRYVFQEELGENATPHLQGLINNKCQVALSTLKSWNPRIHWEATRDIKSSIKYCSDPAKRKEAGRIWSFGFTLPDQPNLFLLDEVDLFAWQRALLEEIRQEPDERRITWYSDEQGGSGKTAFCKFALSTVPRCLFFSGGNFRDISHVVCKSKFDPRVVVLNLPRSSEGKVSYAAIEAIKDGIIQSGKYEGGFKMYAPPHLIVMANFLPDLTQLSIDRWDIRQLHFHNLI